MWLISWGYVVSEFGQDIGWNKLLDDTQSLAAFGVLAVVPPPLLYLLGSIVGWVVRGFSGPQEHKAETTPSWMIPSTAVSTDTPPKKLR
jgi:hypothetical protein